MAISKGQYHLNKSNKVGHKENSELIKTILERLLRNNNLWRRSQSFLSERSHLKKEFIRMIKYTTKSRNNVVETNKMNNAVSVNTNDKSTVNKNKNKNQQITITTNKYGTTYFQNKNLSQNQWQKSSILSTTLTNSSVTQVWYKKTTKTVNMKSHGKTMQRKKIKRNNKVMRKRVF